MSNDRRLLTTPCDERRGWGGGGRRQGKRSEESLLRGWLEDDEKIRKKRPRLGASGRGAWAGPRPGRDRVVRGLGVGTQGEEELEEDHEGGRRFLFMTERRRRSASSPPDDALRRFDSPRRVFSREITPRAARRPPFLEVTSNRPTSLSALSPARLTRSGPSASSPRPAAPLPRGAAAGRVSLRHPLRLSPPSGLREREGARICRERAKRSCGRAHPLRARRISASEPPRLERRGGARRANTPEERGVLKPTRWSRVGAKQPRCAKRWG